MDAMASNGPPSATFGTTRKPTFGSARFMDEEAPGNDEFGTDWEAKIRSAEIQTQEKSFFRRPSGLIDACKAVRFPRKRGYCPSTQGTKGCRCCNCNEGPTDWAGSTTSRE
mmetsp:Transcript_66836/g.112018  ORF Transcript_66836/g.112018 Transcript_66836/m.112018 type:complete len:111 (+) Transcript_66836:332-664(+)